MRLKHEFRFTNGHQTATASDSASAQGSFAGPADEVNATDIARIQAEALATRPKMPTAAAEEEKKKEGRDECMEQDDAPVADKDKDATGGPDAGGCSSTMA